MGSGLVCGGHPIKEVVEAGYGASGFGGVGLLGVDVVAGGFAEMSAVELWRKSLQATGVAFVLIERFSWLSNSSAGCAF